MPYDIDVRDADYRRDPYFHRPAMTIEIVSSDGEPIETIELPELSLTRNECDPAWLAMEDTWQR